MVEETKMKVKKIKLSEAYHDRLLICCECGNVMRVFVQNGKVFLQCYNCGEGYYLVSPEGTPETAEDYEWAIKESIEPYL